MNSLNSHRHSSCSTNNNLLSKPSLLTSYASINSLVNGDGKSKLNNNKNAHDRWICPNDRVLTLRAKLDAGWSVRCLPNSIRSHTPSPTPSPASSMLTLASSPSCPDVSTSNVYNNNNNVHNYHSTNQGHSGATSSSISDEEQSKILSVIERAKQVEIMEKERVNRLNERLRNIKRNVSIESTGRRDICALCCEKFGFLPFTGKSFQCRDCSKLVCSKCMVDQLNPTTNSMIFHCKICSETREMWKKSGAWFLKTLPTFPLLEKPPEEPYSSDTSSPNSIRQRRSHRPNFTIETASIDDDDIGKHISTGLSSDKLQDTASIYVVSESDSFSPNSSNSTTSTGSKTNTAVPSCHFTFQDINSVHQSPSSSSFISQNSNHNQGGTSTSSYGNRRRVLRSESNSPPPPAPSSHTAYSGQLYVNSLLSPSSSSLNSLDSTVTVSSMSIHLPPGSPTPSTISSLSGNTYTTIDAHPSSPASSSINTQFTFNTYDINKLNNLTHPLGINTSPPPPPPAPAPVSSSIKTSSSNKLSFNPSKLLRSPSFRRKVKDKKSNLQKNYDDSVKCTTNTLYCANYTGASIPVTTVTTDTSTASNVSSNASTGVRYQSDPAPVSGTSSVRTSPWFQRRQMKNYPNQHHDQM